MTDPWPVKANIDIKADLTKPAEDITGMAKDTHKGVGKFFYALLGPWIEERIGNAKRGAAQAEKDSLDILAGHARLDEETKTMISIGNVSSVDALCEELEKANSQCKAKRLAAALMAASIEMKQIPEEEVSDEPLNQTFFNHWQAEAELIDDEDLRQWWAHLLVEETKKPNSISPRTLDVAKNLSCEEAALFNEICNFCWNDFLILSDDDNLFDYDRRALFALQDAGLLVSSFCKHSVDGYEYEKGEEKYTILTFLHTNLSIAISRPHCSLSGYQLTKAGRELYKVITKHQNIKHLIFVAKKLRTLYPDSKISIFKSKHPISIDEIQASFISPWDPQISLWQHPYRERGEQIK